MRRTDSKVPYVQVHILLPSCPTQSLAYAAAPAGFRGQGLAQTAECRPSGLAAFQPGKAEASFWGLGWGIVDKEKLPERPAEQILPLAKELPALL